jgi:8-oxo-dGTP pyrophosphatase MutT (NUDIX family)
MKNILDFNQFVSENNLRLSAGLAIVYQGKVLLVHTTGRGLNGWGIPKGGIETGESTIDAAIREVHEEIGIKIPIDMVLSTAYQYTVNSQWGYKLVNYYITPIDDLSQIGLKDLKVSKRQLQLSEIDQARFMDLHDAMTSIMPSQKTLLANLKQLGYVR